MPVFVIGGAVGYLSWNSTPVYRASASLYVALTAGDTASDLNQGSSYTQGQMLSFAKLTTLPIVLTPVIEDLDLDTTREAARSPDRRDHPQNTSILTVSAVGTDPEATAALANSVAGNTAIVIETLAPANESGSNTVKATIVDEAEPPQNPIAPNTKRNVLAALFAGLLLGLLAAYLREVLDTRVRRPEDVEHAISVPVIGTLRADRRPTPGGPIESVLSGGAQAEEIRRIRTNLQMIGRVGVPKSFVFSSALAGEGKSYTSIRVAASLAAAGDRVLLIDADLRRPTVAGQLALEDAAGLTEVLVGRATVEEVAQPVVSGLVVLGSGAVPPNPSELLTSREFEELLEWASTQFDTVIIDAPPLLPVADAVVISRLTTGLLLVMDASKVRRAQLRKAVDSVRLGGGKIVGSVLNRAKVAAAESYAYEQQPSRPKRHRKSDTAAARRAQAPDVAVIDWLPPRVGHAAPVEPAVVAPPSPRAAVRETGAHVDAETATPTPSSVAARAVGARAAAAATPSSAPMRPPAASGPPVGPVAVSGSSATGLSTTGQSTAGPAARRPAAGAAPSPAGSPASGLCAGRLCVGRACAGRACAERPVAERAGVERAVRRAGLRRARPSPSGPAAEPDLLRGPRRRAPVPSSARCPAHERGPGAAPSGPRAGRAGAERACGVGGPAEPVPGGPVPSGLGRRTGAERTGAERAAAERGAGAGLRRAPRRGVLRQGGDGGCACDYPGPGRGSRRAEAEVPAEREGSEQGSGSSELTRPSV